MNSVELRTLMHHYTKRGDMPEAPEGYAEAVEVLKAQGFFHDDMTATPFAAELIGKLENVLPGNSRGGSNVVFMELLLHHEHTDAAYAYSSRSVRDAMERMVNLKLIDSDREITDVGRAYLQELRDVEHILSYSSGIKFH